MYQIVNDNWNLVKEGMRAKKKEKPKTTYKCEICRTGIESIVEGKTRMGTKSKMCVSCYLAHGIGLGPGKGKILNKESHNHWRILWAQ
jgi:hypothetical protein